MTANPHPNPDPNPDPGPVTLVNAGFTRKLGPRSKRQTVNVQGIAVALPAGMLGDKAFRDAVRRRAPAGDGWLLEGYCLVEPPPDPPAVAEQPARRGGA